MYFHHWISTGQIEADRYWIYQISYIAGYADIIIDDYAIIGHCHYTPASSLSSLLLFDYADDITFSAADDADADIDDADAIILMLMPLFCLMPLSHYFRH